MKEMQALVLRNGAVAVESRLIPVAGPTDVVVRATALSMCSADVACALGEFPTPDGTVLGHEAVGVVHEVGSQVTGFGVGQRVMSASNTPCGVCNDCQRGQSGHCGGTLWGGYQYGVTRDGSLAEYYTVSNANFNLASIPDCVSDAAALGVADTFTSGSTGPEAAAVPPGGIVAVFGQGHIGLAAAAFARATGAGLVVTVKARPGGEDLSAAMGADRMFNVQQHDVQTEILKLTNGVGVDCAIEASGQQSSFPTAVSVTRPGGSIVVLSTYHSARGVDLPIPLAEWGWGIGDKTILSTFQQAGSERVSRLLRLAENGRIDPSPLFTRTYKFAEIEQAFADVANRSRGLIKPLVTF